MNFNLQTITFFEGLALIERILLFFTFQIPSEMASGLYIFHPPWYISLLLMDTLCCDIDGYIMLGSLTVFISCMVLIFMIASAVNHYVYNC